MPNPFWSNPAREEDVSRAALAGHHVVRDRHVAPLQPKTVPLVAEILLRHAAIDVFTRSLRMNGDVAVERANLVAGLGHIGRAHGIEHHVPLRIDIARVIDDAPAGRIDHRAVDNRGGIVLFVDAGAVKVHGVAAARIQTGARHLHLRNAVDHHRLAGLIEHRNHHALAGSGIDHVGRHLAGMIGVGRQHRIVDRSALVGAAQAVEPGGVHVHIVVVHEHHVPAACHRSDVLRFERGIARNIRHITRGDGMRVGQPFPSGHFRIGDRHDGAAIRGRSDTDNLHLLVVIDATAIHGRVTGQNQSVAGFPTGGSLRQHQSSRADFRIDGQLLEAGHGRTENAHLAVRHQSAAELQRIPSQVDWARVGEDHAGAHVGVDPLAHAGRAERIGLAGVGPHLKHPFRLDDDRVDRQERVGMRIESQRAVVANRVQRRAKLHIDDHHATHRDQHVCACAGNRTGSGARTDVSPRVRIRPFFRSGARLGDIGERSIRHQATGDRTGRGIVRAEHRQMFRVEHHAGVQQHARFEPFQRQTQRDRPFPPAPARIRQRSVRAMRRCVRTGAGETCVHAKTPGW